MRAGYSGGGSATGENDRWITSIEKHTMVPKETDGHERDRFHRANRSRIY